MPSAHGSATGKIILTGEHAVVYGYPGIAIPVVLTTEVTWSEGPEELATEFLGVLPSSAGEAYVRKVIALCGEGMGRLVRGKLQIQNSIPLGKGMGSSTALVIALCRCVLGPDCETRAKEIEDIVNPGNSGLDFTVIWQNRPVLFRKGSAPEEISLSKDILKGAVLIDTGTPGQTTAELVAWVRERKTELESPLQAIGACTERLIAGESLMTILPDHHRAQSALGVVTKEAAQLINDIERAGGVAKVLGAGARAGRCGMVLALNLSPALDGELRKHYVLTSVKM